MNKSIKTIYEIVSNNVNDLSICEDVDSLTIYFNTNNIHIINDTLNDYVSRFDPEDNFFMNIFFGGSITESCNLLNKTSIADFNNQLQDYINDGDCDPPFKFSFVIRKKKSNGKINIYDFDAFVDYLTSLNLVDFINLIHISQDSNKELFFYSVYDECNLSTKTISFGKSKSSTVKNDVIRNSIIDKSSYTINRNGVPIFDLTPDDFYLQKRSDINRLNDLFDSVCSILSLIYISNYSELFKDKLVFKIIGYKTINIEKDISVLSCVKSNTIDTYFRLYSWIYESETPNISDKCGICRNILSLYLNSENIFLIDDDLYSYTLSCNEIYLKENINKYIEVKGNVVNLLNDLNSKLLGMSKTLSNKLRNNLMALVTFYFTTLLMNTVSTGKINNIFTKDIATISYGFILCSLIYYFISICDYRNELKRYKKFYIKQKKFYSDILIEKEIQDIFMNDVPYHEDLSEIKWNALKYSLLWFSAIFIAIGSIHYLSGYSPVDILLKVFAY